MAKKEQKAQEESNDSGLVQKALYESRTVLLFGEMEPKHSKAICAQLLAMSLDNAEKPIYLYINSPGGHVDSGDSIFDMIQFIGAPVKIIGTGCVASIAAHIYLATELENRYCLPNTRFLLHQPMGGSRGQASDIKIQAEQIVKTKARINRIISERTGQPLDKVSKDTERDHWMDPDEAKAYGMVGQVIQSVQAIS